MIQEEVKMIYAQLLETFERKNEDYGNSFEISMEKYGLISALTRISDKFNRIEHLVINRGSQPNYESLEDSLLDCANYCIMTAAKLRADLDQDKHDKNFI